ncbi:MAG: hypothetical protein J6X18_17110 [Bacteroidales bacterium]|nr:hypothetical protein [Bacteroidales bacterium]
MSSINKNTTIPGQYYSTARGPLDAKMTPADSYEELTDLSRIPVAQRYVGLTVTVLNPTPVEYWLVGGRTNASWKIKAGNIVDTKANLLAISSSACTVGLEMVVQADETNEGKVTKYWVTAIDGANVTWDRKQYGAQVTVEGEDQETE